MKKLFFFISVALSFYAQANILLPAVISSNMVLQQRSSVKLWGWAGPSEKIFITTSWDNKTDSTVTTRDAKWQLQIQTPKAGGPYTITLKGGNTIVLNNVFIGEVWICSGQSNMEFNSYYAGSKDMQPELKNAPNNNIHFFLEPKSTALYPQDDCKSGWTICDSNTLKTFSQVAYFFAKKLNTELNIPIGLIEAAWGGTPAEVWTPADVVNNDNILKQAAAKQKDNPWWPITPGYTYNAMIAPVVNYNIAGAIWYQGEGNTVAPDSYASLFTSMISAWRKQWGKEFPFYYVQIAPFTYGNNYAGAIIREQQTKTLSLSNTGMVVISDLVEDTTNIHPANKHDVGVRLANIALAENYHQNISGYKSPVYKAMTINKDNAVITFDGATNIIMKGKNATQLYIAGGDKIFYPAEAKIKNNELIVWSKQVRNPVAVRYEFSNAGIGNLFNKEGLPVAPFRTDDWEVK